MYFLEVIRIMLSKVQGVGGGDKNNAIIDLFFFFL